MKSVFDADPDYRFNPKSDYFCINCHRAINRSKPHRIVIVTASGDKIVHPDDAHLVPTANAHPFGNDCAERLGLEWTISSEK